MAMDRGWQGVCRMNPSTKAGSRRAEKEQERLSLLVVEDDRLIRESLLDWLSTVLPDWKLVGTRSRALMGQAPAGGPDAIVVDLALSNGIGLDLVRKLNRIFPHAHVVALTIDGDYGTRDAILEAGASAFLPIWKLSEELEPVLRGLMEDRDRGRVDRRN
jgi:DNA-binding NarL/FixJ family response regulator